MPAAPLQSASVTDSVELATKVPPALQSIANVPVGTTRRPASVTSERPCGVNVKASTEVPEEVERAHRRIASPNQHPRSVSTKQSMSRVCEAA